jgi:hypothetical protein
MLIAVTRKINKRDDKVGIDICSRTLLKNCHVDFNNNSELVFKILLIIADALKCISLNSCDAFDWPISLGLCLKTVHIRGC